MAIQETLGPVMKLHTIMERGKREAREELTMKVLSEENNHLK